MPRRRPARSGPRALLALALGLVAGGAAAAAARWSEAPTLFWLVAAGVWVLLTWTGIWRMDAAETSRWATREDPAIAVTHAILLLASVASLGGVALLLAAADRSGQVPAGLLGLGAVAASWATVHTVYTLEYAARYYRGVPGGIDFNQSDPPAYADFAYFGFTLGMTYQVSDTTIGDSGIRRAALGHALLSYFLGAVVLAVAINTVASLVH